MNRRLFASFSAAAVIEATALTGVTASSASADTTSDPVIAAGHLVDAAGAAVTGADVELLMWPSNDVLGQQVEGDSVNLVPVASGLSDSSGNFSLGLADVNSLLAGADTNGLVNFTLLATTPDGQEAHYAFSRDVLQKTVNGVLSTIVASSTDMVDGTIDNLINGTVNTLLGALGLAPVNLVLPVNSILLTLGEAGQSTAAVPDGSVADVPDGGTVLADKNCTSTLITRYSPVNDVVGQQGSTNPQVVSDFTYNAGQSTTFGVGFSGSGAYGSYSASGTDSNSSTITEDFASRTGAGWWHHRSQWIPAKYHVQCWNLKGAVTSNGYELRTYGYAGGASTVSLGTSALPTANYCTWQEPNSGSSRIYSSAITWSGGFEVGSIIGISLSPQTGYSSNAQTSYRWGSKGGYLCGTADYAGQTPRIIIAK